MQQGADLLVLVSNTISLSLPAGEMTVSEYLDDDPTLCGLEIFAQTLMIDSGAAKGLSASAGLKLVFGY